jgi:DNA-binding CsgD family transcriptional regulator
MRVTNNFAACGVIKVGDDENIGSTLLTFENDLKKFGVRAGAYYLVPPFHSQVSKKTIISYFGFSDEFMKMYLDPLVFENDPIPDNVMVLGKAVSWLELIKKFNLSPQHNEFINFIDSDDMSTGIAIPLFGPNSRNSYSVFLLSHVDDLNNIDLLEKIINCAQLAHRKICILVARDNVDQIKLSKREGEVIYWMAHGKSNQDISTILGLSAGTVDTYIRRIYAKLGVNDRISAIIEALGRGLTLI